MQALRPLGGCDPKLLTLMGPGGVKGISATAAFRPDFQHDALEDGASTRCPSAL